MSRGSGPRGIAFDEGLRTNKLEMRHVVRECGYITQNV